MLGHVLVQALVVATLTIGQATRLKKWLPRGLGAAGRPAPVDDGDTKYTRTGVLWSSESNLSVIPENVDYRKLREKMNQRHGDLVCGVNPPVDSQSKRQSCPKSCPLLAEERGNGIQCDFHCVEATVDACTGLDNEKTVPDKEGKLCRPCAIPGCTRCVHDGTDTCEKCSSGFYFRRGKCVNNFWWCWWAFGSILFVVGILLVMWIADLVMRPITCQKRLTHALNLRSRAKLRQPKKLPSDTRRPAGTPKLSEDKEEPLAEQPNREEEDEGNRPLWPLSTNLCRNGKVAGPGLVLSFNFQVAIIIWALVMGCAWLMLGLTVDLDLFVMGTRRWDSPRQQCIVINWGYETQHKLFWTKVGFLAFAYIFTFIGSLLFSIRQLRMFQRMDIMTVTHKDFTAIASGLSGISGERKLEDELKIFFQKETQKMVVAVSISWVYEGAEDEFMSIVDEDMVLRQRAHKQATVDPEVGVGNADDACSNSEVITSDSEESTGGNPDLHKGMTAKDIEADTHQSMRRRLMRSIESVFLSTPVQKAMTRGRAKGFDMRHKARLMGKADQMAPPPRNIENDDMIRGDEHNDEIIRKLQELKTSGKAFVIFNTEKDRDEAIRISAEKGLMFEDRRVTLERARIEPEGIRWENFSDENAPFGLTKKLATGIAWVFLALCIWTLVFYMPYIWISMSASYSYGAAPNSMSMFTFGMLVCAGNALMYTACSTVTDQMRFPLVKDHEVCYMMFYTVACTFNVMLDLVVTCMIAYWTLSGLGTRMYGGLPISESPTFIHLLATYGMQRELGEQVFAYAWPSTFLIPFLLEPIAAVYLPYQLMVWLVRTHSDIHTASAEAYLSSIPFDLSRYADIHLNVILAVLILFFPGGYNLMIFFGLALAHLWIYAYDHVRVLRFCPCFTYASKDVDWWAQWMLAFPCAFLLSALAWKWNQDMDYKFTRFVFGQLGDPEISSIGIAVMIVATFVGHVSLHSCLLTHLVPLFGSGEDVEVPHETYRDCAERLACSWLTSNPIHCLRSDYIYRHQPPIIFRVPGKEHLLLKNEKVGQYFQDKKTKAEQFDSWSPSQILSDSIGRIRGSISSAPKAVTPGAKEERSGSK